MGSRNRNMFPEAVLVSSLGERYNMRVFGFVNLYNARKGQGKAKKNYKGG